VTNDLAYFVKQSILYKNTLAYFRMASMFYEKYSSLVHHTIDGLRQTQVYFTKYGKYSSLFSLAIFVVWQTTL
jgi:hypothetical protein